ncbi:MULTISPECIES: transposase family protein [Rhodococcus]|uniref:transposase family protein n=1 Tax=Rhodococcus TaxID=1827 RepID=UPI002155491B|nr:MULTISPECIES: transposase family protein [Rhodococcus]WKX01675.1 transposase family protein [Rhodococcus aetherivorans]
MSPLAQSASCPECESVSRRIHSRYDRTLADASIGNRASRLVLRVRRFLCPSAECGRRTLNSQTGGTCPGSSVWSAGYACRVGMSRSPHEQHRGRRRCAHAGA